MRPRAATASLGHNAPLASGWACQPFPCSVDLERVEVELAALPVTQNVGRRSVVLVDPMTLGKDRRQDLDIRRSDGEIEIGVRPRLTPEQCVDAPTAVDPPLHTGGIEAVEDVDHVFSGHPSLGIGHARPFAALAAKPDKASKISASTISVK
jgi:hypothetical protein